jgi:MOSC domain-containing protein YiiM
MTECSPVRRFRAMDECRTLRSMGVAGLVEGIHIAPAEGRRMESIERVRAIAGVGLEGDRYAGGHGRWSGDDRPGRDLTLIEAEVVEDLAARHGISLAPGESRRNLTTRGIRLNDLVGHRFRVGEVECLGASLCEPCGYLEGWVGKPIIGPLVHRGGLRSVILTGGEIVVGDEIVDLGPADAPVEAETEPAEAVAAERHPVGAAAHP